MSKRHFTRVLVAGLTATLLLLSGTAATAVFSLYITTTVGGSAVTIDLSFTDPGDAPEFAGFDIQRRSIMQCGSEIIVNDTVLPRSTGQRITHQIIDDDLTLNTQYEYVVLFIDAARQPLAVCDLWDCEEILFDGSEDQTYALYGNQALISHGTLVAYESFAWVLQPCPGTCSFGGLIVTELDLQPYFDSGEPVLILGNIDPECSVEGFLVYATLASPQECNVAKSRRSWGELKAIYSRTAP